MWQSLLDEELGRVEVVVQGGGVRPLCSSLQVISARRGSCGLKYKSAPAEGSNHGSLWGRAETPSSLSTLRRPGVARRNGPPAAYFSATGPGEAASSVPIRYKENKMKFAGV